MSKVNRRVSKDKYIAAAFITLIIFGFGFSLGLVIEGKRAEFIGNQARLQQLEYSSLNTQFLYVDQLASEGNCQAVIKTFEQSINNLEESRLRLEEFTNNAQVHKTEFELLRRDYMLAQIRFWLMSKRSREICDNDVTNVLYFFSDKKECPSCDEQAFVLTYLKKKYGDKLMIFSFDGTYEQEPLITILKQTYGVEEYPFIVIEDEPMSGFTDKDTLLAELCAQSGDAFDECQS